MRRDGGSWVAGGRIYQPIVWDEPTATGDNEVSETYVVTYKKITPDTETNTTETRNNKTTLVLNFPLPQQAVRYIVSVAGKAGTGRGNFSDELTLQYSSMCAYCMPLPVFYTNTQMRHVHHDCIRMSVNNSYIYTSLAGPGAPTSVTVKTQSCHRLKVTWSSPDHTGGLPITGYSISYNDTRNNKLLYGDSNQTMIPLQQLKPGTEYTVRVRAMNAIGEGDLKQHSGNTSQRR